MLARQMDPKEEKETISYEELNRMYREANLSGTAAPDLLFTNIKSLQAIYGKKQVNKWIKDGTVKIIAEGSVAKIVKREESKDANS
jgi:hypothetical protein